MASSLIEAVTGTASGTTDVTITKAANTANGDVMILALITNQTTDRVSSISGTGMSFANVASGSGVVGGAGASYVSLWYAYNVTAATTPTVTIVKVSSCSMQAVLFQVRGLTTTDPLDKVAFANGSLSALASGDTATLSQADEYVLGYGGQRSSGSTIVFSVGAGYGNLTQISVAAGISGAEDKVVAATTAVSAAITSDTNAPWACGVATFKIAATSAVHALSALGVGS